MSTIVLHEGDNRETLRRLIAEGVRVHSAVMDPPYGLTSVVKRFGKDGAAAARSEGNDGAFTRTGAGFMGQNWDGSGIERDPEFWRLIHDILLPGGFCLAFSGARTGHWQAVAMEQAGFIMHPMTAWVFGSGFPKALDASKAIDQHFGVKGTLDATGAPQARLFPGATQHATGDWEKGDGRTYQPGDYRQASAEAAQWKGWKLGTAALKPAMEPIYVGQCPFAEKTGARNLLAHGVGALNIDGCRVAAPGEEITNHARGADSAISKGIYGDSKAQETHQARGQELGRYPANLLHDGSDEVVALFPQSAAAKPHGGDGKALDTNGQGWGFKRMPSTLSDNGDSAARFFNAFPPDWTPGSPEALYYHAKASTRDRVFQCAICAGHGVGAKPACGCADNHGKRKLRGHPTVKPIGLMRHLVRLVTPPGGTVLDPFAGTGTTGAAARAEGFDCILMEAEAAYCGDIRARLNLVSPANPAGERTLIDDLL